MLRGHQWISGIPVCVGLIRCGDAEEEKHQYGEQPEHGAAGRALKPHRDPRGRLAWLFGLVDNDRGLGQRRNVANAEGLGRRPEVETQ